MSRCDNPARVQRAARAAARFVPRLNGAGTPQRGVRYLLQQLRDARRCAGLGTAALNEVRTFCENRGVRAIFVETGRDNAAALAAYRQAGFVDTDRMLLALRLAKPTHEA